MDGFIDTTVVNNVVKDDKVNHMRESSVTVTAHKDFLVDKVRVLEGMEYVMGYPLFAFVSTETDATEMEDRTHSHITYSVPCSELGICNTNVTKEDEKPLPSWKACTVYTVPFDCIVTKVLVKKGTQVGKGQALFVLEPTEIKVGSLDDEHDDALVTKKWKANHMGESSVTVTAHKDFLVNEVRVLEGMEYVMGSPLLAFVSMETDATEMEDWTHSHITYSVPWSELEIYKKNVTKEDEKPLPSWKAFTVYTVPFDCIVTKVLVKEEIQIEKGQALFVLEPAEIKLAYLDEDHDDALVTSIPGTRSYRELVQPIQYENRGGTSEPRDSDLVNKMWKPLTPWKAVTTFCVSYDFIITKILVKEGMQVKKGQDLFVLEPVEIKVSYIDDDHNDALVNKKRKRKQVREVFRKEGQSLLTVVAHKAFLVSKVLIYEGKENEALLPLVPFETIETEEDTGEEDPSNTTSSVACSYFNVWDRPLTEMFGEEYLRRREEEECSTESLYAEESESADDLH